MKPEIVVHIGAHRTGTTSFQEFLRLNDRLFAESGIFALYPPRSRQGEFGSIQTQHDRAILSEENLIGTMENNVNYRALYPNVASNLKRGWPLLGQAGKVYISVRNYSDWWNSAIAFCITRGMKMPNQSVIEEIAKSKRGWPEVIDDVRATFTKAEIVVREFSWKPENPKQHLRKLTDWPEITQANAEKKQHNRSPSASKLLESMANNRDLENLDRIPVDGALQLFNSDQIKNLDDKYHSDIEKLAISDHVTLWGSADTVRSNTENRAAHRPGTEGTAKQVVHCFLNIGKTGSTRARDALAQASSQPQCFIGSHDDTLISTAQKFGRLRKISFVFRHPEKRFVAAFCARLRQGRPHFVSAWSPAEAAAFSFFATPNALAEALYCDDDRLASAAQYAFGNIVHMKRTYTHCLHSAAMLLDEHRIGNITFCCEDTQIEKHYKTLFENFGAPPGAFNSDILKTSEEDVASNPLSPKAARNLKEFWSEDFEIYSSCQKIANDLGFHDDAKSRLRLGIL